MISKHAILRWMERIDGIDILAIRAEMRSAGWDANADRGVMDYLWTTRGISPNAVSSRIAEAWRQGTPSDAGWHVISASAVLGVRGGAVVTVLTHKMYERRAA